VHFYQAHRPKCSHSCTKLKGGGTSGEKKEKKQEQRTQCESYSNVTGYTTGTELYWHTNVDQNQLIRDK